MNKGNDQLNCETCNTFAATVENKTPSKLILKYQATILDKINGTPRPPLSPKSKMGNDFFLGGGGGGWGFAVPFYSVQDCKSSLKKTLELNV